LCGICGIFSANTPSGRLEREVGAMLAAIWHRGPDASGTFAADGIGLGSQRLAIIDLNSGDQPIYNEDRTLALVYNGEIYNYGALRRELIARGHELRTETDSEVVVHLYEDYGPDLVHRLDGMFAFALWDSRRRRLFIARDRFGVKPLYYTWDGTTLAFGSEVKSLIAAGHVKPKLDPDAALELLSFQNILSERSLFAGVKLLEAGSRLELDADGLRIERWWEPLPEPEPGLSADGLPGLLRERFAAAVESQLVADVEVASYLSGGLDTGAITAEAVKHLTRLTTFCTGFDTEGAVGMEAGFDERAVARELAQLLGTHHHELLLDGHDLVMVMGRLVKHLEEPRMSFSYPNHLTAGMASRWVKVVLSGAGGDELFGGYPWRYTMASEPDFREPFYRSWLRLLADDDLTGVLHPDLLAGLDLARPRAVFDGVLDRVEGVPPLDQMLFFEKTTFLHGLLVVEDKLSMAHSLESRVPFLANDLVDFVLTIPASILLADGQSKGLFRKAMASVLPEPVVHRKKTGFTPPQATWFRGAHGDFVERTLLSERATDRKVFNVEFVRRAVAEHRSGTKDRRLLLWTMLGFEWWHRIFVDGEHAA
jgi:asparagine synthase (glutamine-hydrolysing)